MKKQYSRIYEKEVTFEHIFASWNIVRRTCKNKRAVYEFSLNQYVNCYNLYQLLKNKQYKPYSYRLFMIFEPKARLVMSSTVSDKIINHFVADYYLLPYLEKKLIDSNVATRIGKGSKHAEKLLWDYLNQIRIQNKNDEIYALCIDISKYFYNIDHEVLMNQLRKDVEDEDVLHLIQIMIDETDKPYINDTIDKLNKKYKTEIPYYKKGVGLSIGAQTSQFLAIYYLNDLDHLIKEKLGCKYYVRYMDDLIILDTNKEKLKKLWKVIEKEIQKLKLKVNPKSNITKLSVGLSFLGYKYKIENGKLMKGYRKKTIRKIRKKLAVLKKHDLLKYYRSYGSYYGYLNKVTTWNRKFSMNELEKYRYYKQKYMDKILIFKNKKYYYVYFDDVYTLWLFFQNKKIKKKKQFTYFEILTLRKVLNWLDMKKIGYVVITNQEIVIVNC